MLKTMRAQAIPPSNQLRHSPSEPRGPPPSSAKLPSIGANVWPCCVAEDQAAPDQDPTERDDERRHSAVADEESLDSTDGCPEGDPDGQRDDPRVPPVEAEIERVGDPLRLDHRHRVADERELRPDRQVDVARHDDQHHARRHDRDRGALDREVPEVARRQEVAARTDVEAEPDDRQSGDHAEQPEVDLGRRQKPTPSRRLGRRPSCGRPNFSGHSSTRTAPCADRSTQGAARWPVSGPSAASRRRRRVHRTRCRREHCRLVPSHAGAEPAGASHTATVPASTPWHSVA